MHTYEIIKKTYYLKIKQRKYLKNWIYQPAKVYIFFVEGTLSM